MKFLSTLFFAALVAATPAKADDNDALRARYVQVTFDLTINGVSMGSPTIATEIARPGRVAVLDGLDSYRIDYSVRDVFAGQDGQPIADLAAAIYIGGEKGWTLLAEPKTKLPANGEQVDVAIASSKSSPAITLGMSVEPKTTESLRLQLGGSIPDGSECPDADSALAAAKAGDCCGGQCSDGRRWECCGAIQCCNVCPGAQCCQPK